MKYFIVVGEASGDLHGSNLVKAIKKKEPYCEIVCYGGELMQLAGAKLIKHYKEMAYMGFVEILMNLPKILKNLNNCKKDIKEFQPDKVILIDYPGFNFKLLSFVKSLQIPIIYYISPKLWAWNEKRIIKIKQYVNKMLLILPFEVDFYKKHNYQSAYYVGHPLLDAVASFNLVKNQEEAFSKKKILLLPGSRTQEVKFMLPVMLALAKKYPNFHFIIGKASSLDENFYREIMQDSTIELSTKGTYPLLSEVYAAIVTSGTATLETALFKVPQIVCYKGNIISYAIARLLVRHIKYISLVNLILDTTCVTELIQHNLTIEKLSVEFEKITSEKGRIEMLHTYNDLFKILGSEGASERAADIILN